jgi:hypothetical protein
MQNLTKVECKISPLSINSSNSFSNSGNRNIESPFCRKKLDFGFDLESLENESNLRVANQQQFPNNNSLILNDETLKEKIKKTKKTTAIVAGTVQSNNKLNVLNDPIVKLSNDTFTTNYRNYNGKTQTIKVPSNTKRNARERKRVRTINDYFNQLQKYLPHESAAKQQQTNQSSSAFLNKNSIQISDLPKIPVITTTKKLSKVETLKAAIEYIEYLQLFAPGCHYSQKYHKNEFSNKSKEMISDTKIKNNDQPNGMHMLTPSSTNSSPISTSLSPSSLTSPSTCSTNSTSSTTISSCNDQTKNVSFFKSQLSSPYRIITNSPTFKNGTSSYNCQISNNQPFHQYQNQKTQFETTSSFPETSFMSSLPSIQSNGKLQSTFSTNNSILNPIDCNVTNNNYNIHSQNIPISSVNLNSSNPVINSAGSFPQTQVKDSYYYNNAYTQNYVNDYKMAIDSTYSYDTTSLNQDYNYSRIDSLTYGNESNSVVVENNFLKSETYSNYSNKETNDNQNRNSPYSSHSSTY